MSNILPVTKNLNKAITGFIKIWQTDKSTGESVLLVDQPNMILYSGADITSLALAGVKNSAISHFYVGYYNDPDNNGTFPTPIIDKAYSNRFADFATPSGYLRLPLSFPVNFSAAENYRNNIGIYTVVVSADTAAGGASFKASGSDPSWIYEIALVSALDPSGISGDLVFARAKFTPIRYVLNYNLTISWGIQILSE